TSRHSPSDVATLAKAWAACDRESWPRSLSNRGKQRERRKCKQMHRKRNTRKTLRYEFFTPEGFRLVAQGRAVRVEGTWVGKNRNCLPRRGCIPHAIE